MIVSIIFLGISRPWDYSAASYQTALTWELLLWTSYSSEEKDSKQEIFNYSELHKDKLVSSVQNSAL